MSPGDFKLNAEERTIKGKQVNTLRKAGKVPAVIYGKAYDSRDLTVDQKEFKKIFDQASFSQFIELKIGDEKVRVLAKNVQYHPLTGNMVHVEFYRINMKSELTAVVPLVFEGTAPAETSKVGLLITPLEEITVRCLPGDLPSEFNISLMNLKEVGDNILISDIKLPEGVELDSDVDPNQAVAMIVSPQMDESVLEREELDVNAVEATEEEPKDDEEGESESEEENGSDEK